MLQISVYLIVLLIAVLTGFITFRKSHPLYLKLLPCFLLFIFLVEYFEQNQQQPGANNIFLYNLVSTAEFVFYAYYFTQVILGEKVKNKIYYSMYGILIICLINIFLIQGINNFHTYSYALGCTLMVTLSIFYFYQLFKSSAHIDLLREPSFWITTGIIFFYVSSLSIFGMLNYISILPKIVRNSLQKIVLLINAFLYFLFIISFLCKINIRKSLYN